APRIVGLIEKNSGQRIDHHVSGPGIERIGVVRSASGRQHGYVRDASDVEQPSRLAFILKVNVVEVRHERGALASQGHVGHAKIAYNLHFQKIGEHGWITDLKRRCDLHAGTFEGNGDVVDGLPVRTDEIDATKRRA